MNNKFSICIPTYNREELLKSCIDSFIDDAIKYEIPIYISDNDSCDGTEQLIKTYQEQYKYIHYKKQEKNYGMDINMLSALEMSETEYCLWLGDDDTLNPNAISDILSSLNNNPDLVVLKLSDMHRLKNSYNNPYDFFKDYGMIGVDAAMHFSSLIVKIDEIKNLKNKERYIGTLHLYAGLILDYLMEKYKQEGTIRVEFIDKIIINLNIDNNKSWTDKINETFYNYIPAWINYLMDEYKENRLVKDQIELFHQNRKKLNQKGIIKGTKGITKDKLQIILITYNRENHLRKTFEDILSKDSPIKDYNILILDNNSTDGTAYFVKEIMKTHPNLSYQKNKYNLGISGNIAKAMEIAEKEYLWIMADDDNYDWSNWIEVEHAIDNAENAICIAKYAIPEGEEYNTAYQLLQMTFVPGLIIRTATFNDTVMRNAFDNIYTLFPHLCPILSLINQKKKIYVLKGSAIVDNGMNLETTDVSYCRGVKNDELYQRTKTMSWIVGFANICSILKDDKIKYEAINISINYKDIHNGYESFYNFMSKAFYQQINWMQFIDVYINLEPSKRKILLYRFVKKILITQLKKVLKKLKEILKKLMEILKKYLQFIFSVNNRNEHKILTILGLKLRIKRKYIVKNIS